MKYPKPSFSVAVDVTNPGQFFACCGLLELAHRFWPGVEGWFDELCFHIAVSGDSVTSLQDVVARLRQTKLESDDPSIDDKTCPLRLRECSCAGMQRSRLLSLRLDWWLDNNGNGSALKTWAGQQKVMIISRAMMKTAINMNKIDDRWLDSGTLAREPDEPNKVVEPFYFDARRFSHALDTGFSLDVQHAMTTAHPAVEILSLIGLQRFRPVMADEKWSFHYWTWSHPLSASAAAGVVCGAVPISTRQGYQFSLHFRDDQKRYKGFGFAKSMGGHI